MKNQTIPKRWIDWANANQYPTANDRPLVGAKDRAHVTLRLLPLMIHRPDLVALTCLDAGLDLTGEEVLKLAALMASTYGVIVDGLCGNFGEYAVPEALLSADKPTERAKIVAALDDLIKRERESHD